MSNTTLRHLLKTYSYCVKNDTFKPYIDTEDLVCLINIFSTLKTNIEKEGQHERNGNQPNFNGNPSNYIK